MQPQRCGTDGIHEALVEHDTSNLADTEPREGQVHLCRQLTRDSFD
jgi:hypothetical protein